MTQVSVINALMLGQYDGVMGTGELSRHGDFGLGTLDHLDGELIILDGEAYQAEGSGMVRAVGADRGTPFAVATFFDTDGEFRCGQVDDLNGLDRRLDELIGRENIFVAVRIDGRFATIGLRSIPRQEPPYRPLAEVAKSQSVFAHEDVRGTLVGIRSPVWVAGLNVPGYHWHFLSEDRGIGGHVLDCKMIEGRVRYDLCREWEVRLPDSRQFEEADLSEDLSLELEGVERSRGVEKAETGPGG